MGDAEGVTADEDTVGVTTVDRITGDASSADTALNAYDSSSGMDTTGEDTTSLPSTGVPVSLATEALAR